MKTIIFYLLSLLLIFLGIPRSFSASRNTDYINSVNSELYQKLERIKQCQLSKLTPSECRVKLNNKQQPPQVTLEQEQSVTQTNPTPVQMNWWHSSAYKTKPVKKWLQALQANISINEMNGNVEGSQHSISIDYFARYNAWTNRLDIAYSKDNVKQNGVLVSNRQDRLLSISSRYDLDKTWYSKFGFIREKYTYIPLENSDVYFFGLGAHAISTKKLTLSGFLAVGRQVESFSELNQTATGLDEYNYNSAVFSQHLIWDITQKFSFTQSFLMLSSLEDLASFDISIISGAINPDCIETLSTTASFCIFKYDTRQKIKLEIGLEYKLNKYFSLSYNINYNRNSSAILSSETTDTVDNLGINFNYQ